MIVSNEGFAFRSRSSDATFKFGRFVRSKQTTFELPAAAVAARREFTDETKTGVQQPLGAWHFPEPVLEMCTRSERHDQEITLLQFQEKSAIFHGRADTRHVRSIREQRPNWMKSAFFRAAI
jgi:hypothetical protein